MSNADLLEGAASTPAIATSFTTDLGTAVPIANVLDVRALDVSANNDSGIRTRGGASTEAGAGNDLEIHLTNRNTAAVTTADAVPTTLLTVPLGAGDGTYLGEGNLVVYNVTDNLSAGYTFIGVARSSAGVATEVGFEIKNIWEEGAMSACDFSVSASGNNIVVTVVGLAGKTLNWNGLNTYRYVG